MHEQAINFKNEEHTMQQKEQAQLEGQKRKN
jgi:hypothetical protein